MVIAILVVVAALGAHAHVRGTGLGLSLVQDLLRHLGGSIEVESRLDEGSSFTVTIPARHPTGSRVAAAPGQITSDLLASS